MRTGRIIIPVAITGFLAACGPGTRPVPPAPVDAARPVPPPAPLAPPCG